MIPRIPACILYDSEYAHRAITSSDKPEANEKLILHIRDLLYNVTVNRVLDFRHVKAHTGIRGNEFADHLAGQGAKGLQTTSSKRWLERCDAPATVTIHLDGPLLEMWSGVHRSLPRSSAGGT